MWNMMMWEILCSASPSSINVHVGRLSLLKFSSEKMLEPVYKERELP